MLPTKSNIAITLILFVFTYGCRNVKEKAVSVTKTDLKNIYIERVPLPYPPEVSTSTIVESIDSIYKERDLIQLKLTALSRESISLDNKKDRIKEFKTLLDINTAKIVKLQSQSLCGGKDNSQPVELYHEKLGVGEQFVEKISRSVGQLQWRYNFGNEFAGSNNSEGNVKGTRWGTGTLIGPNIFITAGHCFDRDNESGWNLPSKDGQIISSNEMAKLMKVNFNYEIDKTSGKIRTDTVDYLVDSLTEYRNGNLDYAILFLGKDKNGLYPGERFGFLHVYKSSEKQNDIIAIVQHPLGDPKVIDVGRVYSLTNNLISYDDIDTQDGSSGSPVIAANGKIVGIHILGGCDHREDGSNHATPMSLIWQVSPIVKKIAK